VLVDDDVEPLRADDDREAAGPRTSRPRVRLGHGPIMPLVHQP